MLDIARELNRHCAARPAHAEIAIGRPALRKNEWHRGERNHVIYDGRLAEQPYMRGQRRLRPHLPALAFEAIE